MKILKLIGQTSLQLVKHVWSLPQTIADAIQQRERRTMLNALEVERLDRIRNPEKYRGK